MENEYLIPATELCAHYNLELSFIQALRENELIQLTRVEEEYFIDPDELQKIEQYSRWHYELDINLEGIEVIDHLLARIRSLQRQLGLLENQLRIQQGNLPHSPHGDNNTD